MYRSRICKDKDERHYLYVSRLVCAIAAVVMIVLGTLLAYSNTKTIQDTSLILGGILSSGLLGLFFFGFFTKWGDSRAVGIGIGFTLAFTVYAVLGQRELVPMPGFDLYYTAIIGNVVMFVVSMIAAGILGRKKTAPALDNLTIWTMSKPEK